VSISAEAAQRLFEQCCDEGIPLEWSVPFLIRCRGWQVQYFCRDVGIHRSYLSQLLRGIGTAPIGLRLAIRNSLGFDPWRTIDTDTRSGTASLPAEAVS
jgi:hypothetical protein